MLLGVVTADYPSGVIEEISPRDQMFRVRERYLRAGQKGLDCIRLGMVAAGKTAVDSALDLPCGYGRVLRWIRAEFPAARLGGCDIDHHGVDFCAATFGAEPVYGRADPADVVIDAPYDLIWSGSLFTHLPPEQWDGFLELFERALGPGGLVVFTTHGRRIAQLMRDPERRRAYNPIDHDALLSDYEREGIAYVEYAHDPEQRERLALPSTYGISLTRPSAVCAIVERRPGLQLVGFTEGRFNGQDLVSAVRPAGG
ncbi:MAG: class I SAM-dependent methyltransferase [Solirubrobacterales bacterium]